MPLATPTEFQSSASYLAGLGRALGKLGHFEAVVSKASAPAAKMMRSPQSQAWWPAGTVLEMTDAIFATGGAPLLQEIGRLAVFESMSPIVRPFVTILVMLSGPGPATLFSRFSQLTGAAIKHVRFDWAVTSPTAGTLLIHYPMPVPEYYPALWQGAFDFVWETTKKKGTAKSVHQGATLHFELSWEA